MLTNICLTHLRTAGQCVRQQSKRHIASSFVLSQKVQDPIQQLFVNKIREYDQKKKAAGGKLVDLSPELAKSYEDQLSRLEKTYKADTQDMSKFPEFSFKDIAVDIKPMEKSEADTDLPF